MDRQKRVTGILVVLLIVSIGNFSRNSTENIRTVDFLSIWVIGAISGLLIHNLIEIIKKRR